MLFISTTHAAIDEVTLHLEGDLVPPWTQLLEEHARAHFEAGRTVVLDLASVRVASPVAARILEELRHLGRVKLVNCPRLLEEFLGDA